MSAFVGGEAKSTKTMNGNIFFFLVFGAFVPGTKYHHPVTVLGQHSGERSCAGNNAVYLGLIGIRKDGYSHMLIIPKNPRVFAKGFSFMI
jgi:hypothetical protein